MPQFVPISRDRHAALRWRRYESYAFARSRAVVPLVGAELAKATLAFPIAILSEGDATFPVALLSLDPQRNLLVAPDGRWLGNYVPAALRAHPFGLLNSTGGDMVFCIDEESGLLDDGEEGEPFFDATGEVAGPTRKVLDFLTSIEQSRGTARRACAVLAEAGLVAPWDITLRTASGEQKVGGLLKIDEAALNALPADRFETVRQAGAVPLAYCQMLSMQHLPALGRLAEAHAAQAREAETLIKQSFTPENAGEIDIDWSVFSADPGAEGSK